MFPELASGLVKFFEFALESADKQTGILARETAGIALSDAVAGLVAGDRVELEWRQCRVEMDTDVDDRFHIVEQCNKLVKIDAAAEGELLKAFPQPQIMINRNGSAGRGSEKAKERNSRNRVQVEVDEKKKGKKKIKKGKKKGKKGRKRRP